MGKRALLVVLWLPWVLFVVPLLVFSVFTWIITGNNLDAQLDWYVGTWERLYGWAVGSESYGY